MADVLNQIKENMREANIEISDAEFIEDTRVSTMLVKSGLCKSQSDARKQIEQNAVSVNDQKITDPLYALTREQIGNSGALLKKGKKGFCRIIIK